MADIESIFISLFGILGKITGAVRNIITSMAPQYATLILLAIAGGLGFYLSRKYPLSQRLAVVYYGVIIFLILRFI